MGMACATGPRMDTPNLKVAQCTASMPCLPGMRGGDGMTKTESLLSQGVFGICWTLR